MCMSSAVPNCKQIADGPKKYGLVFTDILLFSNIKIQLTGTFEPFHFQTLKRTKAHPSPNYMFYNAITVASNYPHPLLHEVLITFCSGQLNVPLVVMMMMMMMIKNSHSASVSNTDSVLCLCV